MTSADQFGCIDAHAGFNTFESTPSNTFHEILMRGAGSGYPIRGKQNRVMCFLCLQYKSRHRQNADFSFIPLVSKTTTKPRIAI